MACSGMKKIKEKNDDKIFSMLGNMGCIKISEIDNVLHSSKDTDINEVK